MIHNYDLTPFAFIYHDHVDGSILIIVLQVVVYPGNVWKNSISMFGSISWKCLQQYHEIVWKYVLELSATMACQCLEVYPENVWMNIFKYLEAYPENV